MTNSPAPSKDIPAHHKTSPHSQYVRADDYEAVRLESEAWRARAIRAEQMNRDLLRSALERWKK